MRAAHAEKRFAQNAEPLQSFHQLLQGLQVFKTHRILNLLTEAFCTMCSVCLPGHSSDITRLRTTRSQDYSFGNSGVCGFFSVCADETLNMQPVSRPSSNPDHGHSVQVINFSESNAFRYRVRCKVRCSQVCISGALGWLAKGTPQICDRIPMLRFGCLSSVHPDRSASSGIAILLFGLSLESLLHVLQLLLQIEGSPTIVCCREQAPQVVDDLISLTISRHLLTYAGIRQYLVLCHNKISHFHCCPGLDPDNLSRASDFGLILDV